MYRKEKKKIAHVKFLISNFLLACLSIIFLGTQFRIRNQYKEYPLFFIRMLNFRGGIVLNLRKMDSFFYSTIGCKLWSKFVVAIYIYIMDLNLLQRSVIYLLCFKETKSISLY